MGTTPAMPKLRERSAVLAGAVWWGLTEPTGAEPGPAATPEVWPPPLSEVVAAADAEARRHEPPLVQAVAAQACRAVLESPTVVDLTDAPRRAAGANPVAART